MANFPENTAMPTLPTNKRTRDDHTNEQLHHQSYKRTTTESTGYVAASQYFETPFTADVEDVRKHGTYHGFAPGSTEDRLLQSFRYHPISGSTSRTLDVHESPQLSGTSNDGFIVASAIDLSTEQDDMSMNHNNLGGISSSSPPGNGQDKAKDESEQGKPIGEPDRNTDRSTALDMHGAKQPQSPEPQGRQQHIAKSNKKKKSLQRPSFSFELSIHMEAALRTKIKSTLVAPFEWWKIGPKSTAIARNYVQTASRCSQDLARKSVPGIHPKFVPDFRHQGPALLQPDDIFQFRHLFNPAKRLEFYLDFVTLGLIMQETTPRSIWYWRSYLLLKIRTSRLWTDERAFYKQHYPGAYGTYQERQKIMQRWKKIADFQALNARQKPDGKWENFSPQQAAGVKRAVEDEGEVNTTDVQKKTRSHGQYIPGRDHVVLQNQPPLLDQPTFMANSQLFQRPLSNKSARHAPTSNRTRGQLSLRPCMPRAYLPPPHSSFDAHQQPFVRNDQNYNDGAPTLLSMGEETPLEQAPASHNADMSPCQQIQSAQEQEPKYTSILDPEGDPWVKKNGVYVWKKQYPNDLASIPEPPFTALEDFTQNSEGRWKCFHEKNACVQQECNHRCCRSAENGGGLDRLGMRKAIRKAVRAWRGKIEEKIDTGLLDKRHRTWNYDCHRMPVISSKDGAKEELQRTEQAVAKTAEDENRPGVSGGLFAGAAGYRPPQAGPSNIPPTTTVGEEPKPQVTAEDLQSLTATLRAAYVKKHPRHPDLAYFNAWWAASNAEKFGQALTHKEKIWRQQKNPRHLPDKPTDNFWVSVFPASEKARRIVERRTVNQEKQKAREEAERHAMAEAEKTTAAAREAEDHSQTLDDVYD